MLLGYYLVVVSSHHNSCPERVNVHGVSLDYMTTMLVAISLRPTIQ
jgi:hypothetical protein